MHPLAEAREGVRPNVCLGREAEETRILQENVACAVDVTIDHDATGRTLERLLASKLVMQRATDATRLGGVRLVADHDLAPWVLLPLEQQTLFEAIVRPCHHGPGCFAPNFALRSCDHLLRLERR